MRVYGLTEDQKAKSQQSMLDERTSIVYEDVIQKYNFPQRPTNKHPSEINSDSVKK